MTPYSSKLERNRRLFLRIGTRHKAVSRPGKRLAPIPDIGILDLFTRENTGCPLPIKDLPPLREIGDCRACDSRMKFDNMCSRDAPISYPKVWRSTRFDPSSPSLHHDLVVGNHKANGIGARHRSINSCFGGNKKLNRICRKLMYLGAASM